MGLQDKKILWPQNLGKSNQTIAKRLQQVMGMSKIAKASGMCRD